MTLLSELVLLSVECTLLFCLNSEWGKMVHGTSRQERQTAKKNYGNHMKLILIFLTCQKRL